MRIIFMGSPDFAVPSLEALYYSSHEILAVVSGKDKRRGRGKTLSPTPVKEKALQLKLPVIEAEDLKSAEFEQKLRKYDPDLFVVVAFRILPENILAIPKVGSINLHASLLPKYRGAAPIHWAVMSGEKETGCSIFFLDRKVDTGNVILQKKTPIGENETTGDVYDRLMNMGSHLLLKAVDSIEQGSYTVYEQDHFKATSAPKIFREDCQIDFTKDAMQVHNKIRGLSPFPVAWTKLDGQLFKIYETKVAPKVDVAPGEIEEHSSQVFVGCGEGTLELLKVQMQGKSVMKATDFFNGYKGDKILGK